MAEKETVLIVGAGQAGAWAALTLRAEGFDGRVILAGAEAHPPYERPPLSKSVLLGAEPGRAHLRPLGDYASLDIELRTGAAVSQIEPAGKTAHLHGGERIAFDKLVLTTGSAVRRLSVPGSDFTNVVCLRTIDDALALRARLAQQPRVLVVGGGLIGLEVAAGARAMNCAVTVVEAQGGLMQRVAPPEIGAHFERLHRDRGVAIHLNAAVHRLDGEGCAERAVLVDGRVLHVDLVVVAIGVVPDTTLAAASGLAIDDGIAVDTCGRTSHPDVFAAGDVASHPNEWLGRRVRLESWHNAQNQAIAAAKTLCGRPAPYRDVPWFWSDQFKTNLQIAGMTTAAERIVTRGDRAGESFSIFYLRGGRVAGLATVNAPRDMGLGRRLVEQRCEVDPLRLADPQVPLKKLLR